VAEPAFVLRVAGFLALLVSAGWMAARVERRGVDLFAATWWGLAITSVAGVLLARSGRFSLMALGAAVAAVGVLAAVIDRARGPATSSPASAGTVAPWCRGSRVSRPLRRLRGAGRRSRPSWRRPIRRCTSTPAFTSLHRRL
jgi:hypothetical protein